MLNITQPSLSQYVKKIERQVGTELFDRTSGDVRLTDAGRVYIEAGRKILDLEHQMEMRLADIAEHKAGTLIVGTTPYRAAVMMPEIARLFQGLYPGMHRVVQEGTTTELIEGMEHGEFDLCLTMLPLDERLFTYEDVVEEEMVLAVPASYPEIPSIAFENRKYPAVNASQINGQPFVMLTDTQYMQRQLENMCIDYKLSLKTSVVVKSLEAQIAMVRAGVGMALLPTGIECFCAKDEVRFYSLLQELPRRQVVVMWRKDMELSKIAVELKNLIHGIAW